MPPPDVLEFSTLARTFGIVTSAAVLVGLVLIAAVGRGAVLGGLLTFGGVRIVLLILLFALPITSIATANYFVFEETKRVEACNQCHVMQPIVADMRDPKSQTLAARHYKFRWIQKEACHTCHADYGLQGDMLAKTDGFRHLVKYVSGTYREPIVYRRRPYNNANCSRCHEGLAVWEAVSSHMILVERLRRNETECVACHGIPHPPVDRTKLHE